MTYIHNELAYENAIRRNIRDNAYKTFHRTYEDAHEVMDFVRAGADRGNEFFASLLRGYDQYGRLSEKQVAAVRKCMEQSKVRKAEWTSKQAVINATKQFIGEVGKRITMTLTTKKVIQIQGQSFSYYDSGISYLHIAENAEGNVVIYIGNGNFPGEGETANVKVTIKSHGVRNDCKQTMVSRPSIV